MNENSIGCLFAKEEVRQFLIDEIIQQLFWQIAKIHLKPCKGLDIVNEELYTVYTTFSGGYKARFSFCAERALMKRIAENMAEEPVTDMEDIAEYMKEFINVVCGHLVASIFYQTKKAARFHCPEFTEGYHVQPDEEDDIMITTYYLDEHFANAMLMYDKTLPMAG